MTTVAITTGTQASVTAVLATAAQLIRSDGYDRYSEYRDAPGYSLVAAVETAARHAGDDDPDMLAEETLTRLAGFLYLTGLRTRRTSIADMSDVPDVWERGSDPRTAAEVLAVLDTATAALTAGSQL